MSLESVRMVCRKKIRKSSETEKKEIKSKETRNKYSLRNINNNITTMKKKFQIPIKVNEIIKPMNFIILIDNEETKRSEKNKKKNNDAKKK